MPFDVPIFQLITYAALTGMSVTVAGVSLYVTFRQNRGWKPIVLSTTRARMTPPPSIFLGFEVWNRRKYPVVIQELTVVFKHLKYVDPPPKPEGEEDGTEWSRNEKEFLTYPEVMLDPNSHDKFFVIAPFEAADVNESKEIARIDVRYFDPIRNRHLTIMSDKIDV